MNCGYDFTYSLTFLLQRITALRMKTKILHIYITKLQISLSLKLNLNFIVYDFSFENGFFLD